MYTISLFVVIFSCTTLVYQIVCNAIFYTFLRFDFVRLGLGGGTVPSRTSLTYSISEKRWSTSGPWRGAYRSANRSICLIRSRKAGLACNDASWSLPLISPCILNLCFRRWSSSSRIAIRSFATDDCVVNRSCVNVGHGYTLNDSILVRNC